jgi:hypothetical protein
MLCSHAAHGISTDSLKGIGEITLRDALVVAAASIGAKQKRAWLLSREIEPDGWTDAAVDLMIYRVTAAAETLVGGTELKWWRQADVRNSSNRRTHLVRDFVRAAALYNMSESFAFVALLSIKDSWVATTDTRGGDKPIVDKIKSTGSELWSLNQLSACPSIRATVKGLKGKVPIASSFRTKLAASCSLSDVSGTLCTARVWEVSKVRNSHWIESQEELAKYTTSA